MRYDRYAIAAVTEDPPVLHGSGAAGPGLGVEFDPAKIASERELTVD